CTSVRGPQVRVLDHLVGDTKHVAGAATVRGVPAMLVDRQAHPRLAIVGDVVVGLLVSAGTLIDEPRRFTRRHAPGIAGAVLDHDPLARRRESRTLVRVALGDQLDLDRVVRRNGSTGKSWDLGLVGHDAPPKRTCTTRQERVTQRSVPPTGSRLAGAVAGCSSIPRRSR